MFTCGTLHNSQDMEQTYVHTDGWRDKGNVAHVHGGVLFGYKEEWNPGICDRLDESEELYVKWN